MKNGIQSIRIAGHLHEDFKISEAGQVVRGIDIGTVKISQPVPVLLENRHTMTPVLEYPCAKVPE